jgi:AraC-like DNA-binding protein
VAGPAGSLAEVRARYREAYARARQRVFLGEGVVVGPGSRLSPQPSSTAAKHFQRGVEAARDRDQSAFQAATEGLLRELRTVASAMASQLVVQFALAVSRIPVDAGVTMGRIEEWPDVEALERRVAQCECPEDVSSWLLELFQACSQTLSDANAAASSGVMRQVFEYLGTHYADPQITESSVAEQFGLSPSHFSRLFHREAGQTFPRYVGQLRLARARDLLAASPHLEITDVMARVGFTNASYFAARFRKAYGVTPSVFRIRREGRGA